MTALVPYAKGKMNRAVVNGRFSISESTDKTVENAFRELRSFLKIHGMTETHKGLLLYHPEIGNDYFRVEAFGDDRPSAWHEWCEGKGL